MPPLLFVGGVVSILLLQAADKLSEPSLDPLMNESRFGPYSTRYLRTIAPNFWPVLSILTIAPLIIFIVGAIAIFLFGES